MCGAASVESMRKGGRARGSVTWRECETRSRMACCQEALWLPMNVGAPPLRAAGCECAGRGLLRPCYPRCRCCAPRPRLPAHVALVAFQLIVGVCAVPAVGQSRAACDQHEQQGTRSSRPVGCSIQRSTAPARATPGQEPAAPTCTARSPPPPPSPPSPDLPHSGAAWRRG